MPEHDAFEPHHSVRSVQIGLLPRREWDSKPWEVVRADDNSSRCWVALSVVAAVGCGQGVDTQPDRSTESSEAPLDLDCKSAAFVPCGGDVVGRWRFDSGCVRGETLLPRALLPEGCSETGFSFDMGASGEAEFDEAGSFSYSLTLDGQFALDFAPGCLKPDAGCSELESLVPLPDLTCVGVAALGCTCSFPLDDEGSEAGTFSTREDRLLLTAEGSLQADSVAYCRATDALLIRLPVSGLPDAGLMLVLREG